MMTTSARTTQLSNTTAMLDACKLELGRTSPDFDRAYHFAEHAFDLVGLMRIEQAAGDRAGKAAQ